MSETRRYEITSVVFRKETFCEVFKTLLARLSSVVDHVDIMFGSAWGNVIYPGDWIPRSVAPSKIMELVTEQTRKGVGEIGYDDFYISLPREKMQILVCHDCDLHITYESETAILKTIKDVIRPEEWKAGFVQKVTT